MAQNLCIKMVNTDVYILIQTEQSMRNEFSSVEALNSFLNELQRLIVRSGYYRNKGRSRAEFNEA